MIHPTWHPTSLLSSLLLLPLWSSTISTIQPLGGVVLHIHGSPLLLEPPDLGEEMRRFMVVDDQEANHRSPNHIIARDAPTNGFQIVGNRRAILVVLSLFI